MLKLNLKEGGERQKRQETEEMNEDQGNELQEFMEKAQRKASRWVGIVCYLIL